MKKFLFKVLLFLLPLSIPYILFVYWDPYMLFGDNKGKIKFGPDYNVASNRDFQTVELFLQNYRERNYDSFFFGNSRAFFFSCEKWQKYAPGQCFHFNAYNESLYGLDIKLKFLAEKGVKVKNALFAIDRTLLLNTSNSPNHLFRKHPATTSESYLHFYHYMFKGFFPEPFAPFADFFITGKRKPYMFEYGISSFTMKLDSVNNRFSFFLYDSLLEHDEAGYYADKHDLFYERDSVQIYSNPTIGEAQIALLNSIHQQLEKQSTEYKFIINPLYDQKKLSPADLEALYQILGRDRVYDFSGINAITNDYRNYYELSHYRPHVADSIMELLYQNTD